MYWVKALYFTWFYFQLFLQPSFTISYFIIIVNNYHNNYYVVRWTIMWSITKFLDKFDIIILQSIFINYNRFIVCRLTNRISELYKGLVLIVTFYFSHKLTKKRLMTLKLIYLIYNVKLFFFVLMYCINIPLSDNCIV